MKIWIINQYATLPSTGVGIRHRHLARGLAALGHDVTIVAARWTHLTRDRAAADAAPQVDHFEGFRFVSLDLLRYRHAHDRKRVLNWFLFAVKLLGIGRLLNQKPDVVIYSSPALVGFLAAERLARWHGAKLVFEVRDIWPLTLTQIGGFSPRHPVIRLFQWIEDRACRKADLAISNLPGAVDHMVRRGLPADRFRWIPNGMSFAESEPGAPAPEALQARIPAGKFVVGYSGTMGNANAVETLIDTARQLRDDPKVVFVLLGDGKDRTTLEDRVARDGLTNVVFLGSVPRAQVPDIIRRFDACWIGWKISPLYDFGVAANKLFEYFFAGLPVLHSFSGRHDPVVTYDAGMTVPAEDPDALARAILGLRDLSQERRTAMGQNGRRAVMEHHDYARLAGKLNDALQE